MSHVPVPRESFEAPGDGSEGGLGAAIAPAMLRSPSWPTRVATSALLMLAITLAVAAPLLLTLPDTALALGFAVLGFGGAGVARIVFEALAPPAQGRRRWRVVAALAGGLAAVALAWCGEAIAGTGADPLDLAAAIPVVAALLLVAASLRNLELRLGANARRIFFLGGAAQFQDLRREATRRGDMRLAGRMGLERCGEEPAALAAAILAIQPTIVVMAAEATRQESFVAAASALNLRGVRVRALNEFYEREFAKVPLAELSPSWFLFDVAEIHRPRVYGAVKRVVEGGISALLLVAAAPLMPAIALAVKLSSPGPLFYRQVRVGKDGEHFPLTKFRTMRISAGEAAWATEQPDRITRVGGFLRRYRFDEVPQLWHVVRGQMSLVGPRPEQPEIVERLARSIEFYSARHHVRPGITGWAQVNEGYGGSLEGTLEKLQFEFFYIKHQSVRLDARIIVATVRTVLAGRGS